MTVLLCPTCVQYLHTVSDQPEDTKKNSTTNYLNCRCKDEPGFTCTGMRGPYNLEIVDRVEIPRRLAAGYYVLGWRWDCEESNQIWSSCSDITIVA